jgi:hypothetical protein
MQEPSCYFAFSKIKSGRYLPLITLDELILSTDGCRFTKMFLLHGNPAASTADIFHSRQLILAYMGMVNIGSTAEAALFRVAAGIA